MRQVTPKRYYVSIALGSLVLTAMVLLSPGIGSTADSITLHDAWRAKLGMTIPTDELLAKPLADLNSDGRISAEESDLFHLTASDIGFKQRMSRSLLALVVGTTLAICGATFQVLFRNVLATPYTLGIASGGSLGALIAIRAGWEAAYLGISSLAIAAFVGGLLVVAAVFVLGRGSRRLTSNELLLAGVTMGLFCSALMMVVTVISSERQTFRIVRWMMGSLDTISSLKTTTMLPLVIPAWIVLLLCARSLNQYRLGDELAATRGVNVARLQMLCVLVATLATAAVVATCGPIGFVGLVVPHIAALIVSRDCRILFPMAALAGGAFLILSDWASVLGMTAAGWATGSQMSGATLPIGVVTAILGVPIFLILLRTKKT